MVKYKNTLFFTHNEISQDWEQVDGNLIEMSDDDRTFFNLKECGGIFGVIKVIRGIILANEFDNYILCVDRKKGIQFTDFLIRTLFQSSPKKLILYLPAIRSYNIAEIFFRRNFFRNHHVIVSNVNDINMVREKLGNGTIELV